MWGGYINIMSGNWYVQSFRFNIIGLVVINMQVNDSDKLHTLSEHFFISFPSVNNIVLNAGGNKQMLAGIVLSVIDNKIKAVYCV